MVNFSLTNKKNWNVEFSLVVRSQPIIITDGALRDRFVLYFQMTTGITKNFKKKWKKAPKRRRNSWKYLEKNVKTMGWVRSNISLRKCGHLSKIFIFFIFTLVLQFCIFWILIRQKLSPYFPEPIMQMQSETSTNINATYLKQLKAFSRVYASSGDESMSSDWPIGLLTFLLWVVKCVFINIWLNG